MYHSARKRTEFGHVHARYEGGEYIEVMFPDLRKSDLIDVINVWDYKNGQTTLGQIPGVSPQKEVAKALAEWLREHDRDSLITILRVRPNSSKSS